MSWHWSLVGKKVEGPLGLVLACIFGLDIRSYPGMDLVGRFQTEVLLPQESECAG